MSYYFLYFPIDVCHYLIQLELQKVLKFVHMLGMIFSFASFIPAIPLIILSLNKSAKQRLICNSIIYVRSVVFTNELNWLSPC